MGNGIDSMPLLLPLSLMCLEEDCMGTLFSLVTRMAS